METKKRYRFQIHLSTAIVLMFTASMFLYLNIGLREFTPGGPSGEFEIYGFPMRFEKYNHYNIDTGVIDSASWQNDDQELVIALVLNGFTLIGVCGAIITFTRWYSNLRTSQFSPEGAK